MTIVCGDSHTATHGAFGALAFGIGTSEVEHVLATQCLVQRKPKSMRIRYEGELGFGVTAKDLILGTIGQIGVDGAAGHVVEYAGPGHRGALDGGPHDGLQHDHRGRRARGHGRARRHDVRLGRAEHGAEVDPALARAAHRGRRDASTARSSSTPARSSPMVTWGTNPAQVVAGHRRGARARDARARSARWTTWTSSRARRSQDIRLDRVFIGSCTNSRIGDLRAAARVVEGRKVASDVYAMVVPGSVQVKAPGRGRGPRRGLPRRRLRLARRGLLDVPGHEPRHPQAGRALRLDLEPQLRGPPGPRRAHAPRQPRDGRRRRHRGPLRRHPRLELAMKAIETITGPVSVLNRDDVDTDQIIPKQFLKRVERTGFGEFLFYDWAKEPDWDLPRNQILVAGRNFGCGSAASTRPGRWRTTASGRSSRRASPTSSAPTARRSACCRSSSRRATCARDRRGRRGQVDLADAGGRAAPGGTCVLRHRPGDQAPPAQRPRRHRADAPAGRRDRRLRARPRAQPGPVTTAL